MLSLRRHRKNPLILSASATGIIVGLLVCASMSLAISLTTSTSAQANTSSSQTVKARDNDITRVTDPNLAGAPMPALAVTVSQTQGLLSQAIEVSWTGGKQSTIPSSGTGGSNYLQIAQCWGEDLHNPGHPDRTTCQFGAFGDQAGSARSGPVECPLKEVEGDTVRLPPVVSSHDYSFTTGKDADYAKACDRSAPTTSIPFRSVGNAGSIASVLPDPTISGSIGPRLSYEQFSAAGTPLDATIQQSGTTPVPGGAFSVPTTAQIGGESQQLMGVNTSSNQFFTKYTTNEVPWAGTSSDGRGSIKFEIQTAVQTPALGCGAVTEDSVTHVRSSPQSCWLVVIPRGIGDSGSAAITKSGLWWDAWQHNIAFKLDFRPTAQRCAIGGTEKQLSGSELVSGAISSWQPSLCLGATGATFVVSSGNEAAALKKASGTIPSPLALTSRPLQTTGKDPVQYAPIALSGLAISFAIDRFAVPGHIPGKTTPPDYIAHNTEAFPSMNLTPRLVAKLLTNSYWYSLPPVASKAHIGYIDGTHVGPNARALIEDSDFLSKQTGDEWGYQFLTSVSLADLLVPNGQSDGAVKLWEYALSDQEGRDFLSGKPDEWGMKVNPFYSTVDNAYSPALTLPAVTFPKADPITRANSFAELSQGNDSVNLLTYRPYTSGFEAGAYDVLRGNGLALGSWNDVKKTYDKAPRELIGTQKVLAVTTTEAAERYKNITASLRNPAGNFVAPTTESMTAAASAMTASAGSASVFGFDFTSTQATAAAGAYPMTMPIYAAVNPLQTDATLRATYAGFIRYAVKDGQIQGVGVGQLPSGYAPIPQTWVDQSMVSANAIEQGISPLSLVAGTTVVASAPNGAAAQRAPAPVAPVTSESAVVANPNPSATGAPAAALAGKPTPADPVLGPVAAAVPAGLLSGFAAAGAVPFYSRYRRRR